MAAQNQAPQPEAPVFNITAHSKNLVNQCDDRNKVDESPYSFERADMSFGFQSRI
jgi:hypothetical protein